MPKPLSQPAPTSSVANLLDPGIGSAVLGVLADRSGIPFVFQVCSYLPLIGLLTALLPNLERAAEGRQKRA